MSKRSLMLCLTLLVPVSLGPRAATAQTASLEPGARVRVTSAALHLDHVQGVVSESGSNTLTLFLPYSRMVRGRIVWDSTRRDVPLDAVDALEVSTGTASNFGRGLLGGTLVGAGLGVALAVGMSAADSLDGADLGTAVGGMSLLGMLLGGFIGAASHHDIWETTPVRPSGAPVTLHMGRAPDGGRTVGVGMTLRF